MRPVPKFAVGGWVWVYNTAATICQGVKTDTDAKVLKAKLSLNWTAPYKVLAVGPCTPADTPNGSLLGAKLLNLDLPSDMPGADARRRVSVQALCQPPRPYRRAEVFSSGVDAKCAQQFLKKIQPVPRHSRRRFYSSQILEVEKITGHLSVGGRGGVITVMFETH